MGNVDSFSWKSVALSALSGLHQAWAADVDRRRAAHKDQQMEALRASIASGEVNIDSRPGSIYVQPGDNLSKIAARFPEYGNANDLKNQLIAANPWLADPNALRAGMEMRFPDAGTAVDSAAMARAMGADAQYQAAVAARQAQLATAVASADDSPAWSFREASMAQRKLDDVRELIEYQARIAKGPGISPWDGIQRRSAAESYLTSVRGGLDAVRGDNWQFRVAQGLPEAALNEVGGLLAGKALSHALGWGDQVAARVTWLDPYDALQIINTPKDLRPLPETYMPQSMVDAHAALFSGGATRIQPSLPTATIGRTETWVMPTSFADEAIAEASGDVRKLEQLLGLDRGYLGSSPVRVDIPRPVGVRMSSGKEYGANHLWNPGGYTNGGVPEAVINSVPAGAYPGSKPVPTKRP